MNFAKIPPINLAETPVVNLAKHIGGGMLLSPESWQDSRNFASQSDLGKPPMARPGKNFGFPKLWFLAKILLRWVPRIPDVNEKNRWPESWRDTRV